VEKQVVASEAEMESATDSGEMKDEAAQQEELATEGEESVVESAGEDKEETGKQDKDRKRTSGQSG
jgi:hypothetical protein